MADNETTTDIIAWLRRPREGENAYLTLWRDEIADRLEAAHKREVATTKESLAVGNSGDCAKLREALRLYDRIIQDRTLICDCDIVCRARTLARAALAAPPRNCDLARDWMRDLYAHFKPPASIKREMPPEWVDSVMAFCRWLVAPATEKEGGAK